MSNSTSSTTSSDGCVVCPTTPACPTCDDDEYCVMTSLTCSKCPTTYCSPRSSSQFSSLNNSTSTTSTNSSDNGGTNHTTKIVVGSVIGGIAALVLLVGALVYQWYWKPRRKHSQLKLKEDMNMFGDHNGIHDELDDEFTDDDDEDEYTDDDDEGRGNNNERMNGGVALDYEALDELTSLNDYGYNRKGNTSGGHHRQHQSPSGSEDIVQLRDLSNHSSSNNLQRNAIGGNPPWISGRHGSKDSLRKSMLIPGNRTSTTSTIRTNASNVLPIAYIPGVTSAGHGGTIGSGNSNNNNHNSRRTPTSLNSSNSALGRLNKPARHQLGNGSGSSLNVVGDTGSHITLGSSILGGLDEDFDDMSINMTTSLPSQVTSQPPQQEEQNIIDRSATTTMTSFEQDNNTLDEATGTDLESAMDTSLGTIKIGLGNNLMTAIKAKPKLIQINEEEDTDNQYELNEYNNDNNHEEEENDDDDDDDDGSFLLDVELPSSLRNETNPSLDPNPNQMPSTNNEEFKSPFDDAFEIDSE
ncbi:similar to Saccharomyces cerevisiae YPR075C OPY2 Integral membrane protein that functions in the signaling branch of the high-osmolarity glycerol (HOG) pathway [Maudiozyma saulgeensis]|uniref:Similar to Saccharomyces cerevisiae YPR075C OPY2 Integral membrane protein that functions in the signaling branch of the high-osmolarity glycerol (HOG) pathway n=1 Tax=Maudiozyma saulgeensis TaxID=1789683 RepID=A0A1X7R4M2_9SACH|nr:similar to Saccharomyces cerevisiae YPR075C OPY2 Integral membrane protein that functions in the signaling branch of the high-osmolarity glycerol (HOG) pathway [Kazachstania saulgeensis]